MEQVTPEVTQVQLARELHTRGVDVLNLIYRCCHEELVRFCRRRVDLATAEDIAQETLLRALACAQKIDPIRPLFPLLRTIAANLCIDVKRRHRNPASFEQMRQVEEAMEDEQAPPRRGYLAKESVRLADADPTFEHAVARVRFSRVLASLLELSERPRRMVLRRSIDGLPYTEIGKLEGTSEVAAKHVVRRGWLRLRELTDRPIPAPPGWRPSVGHRQHTFDRL